MRAHAPTLPAVQQLALVVAWQQQRDRAARDRLVLASEGLVWTVAARFAHAGAEWDDVVAEARLALVRACDTYPCRGVDFGGWAYGAVRQAVLDLVRAAQRDAALHEDLEAVPAAALARDPEQDDLVDAQAALEQLRRVGAGLARLSPYWQALLQRRLLAEHPVALVTLARELGVGRASLHNIERLLLARIGGALTPYYVTA